jgi:hypothetical protein
LSRAESSRKQLAARGIRAGKNIEAIIIDLLEAAAGRWK